MTPKMAKYIITGQVLAIDARRPSTDIAFDVGDPGT